MKQIIIGLGTGRCGTRSLTKLFKENGYDAFHEQYHLPWEQDYKRAGESIVDLEKRTEKDTVASVAFYWLKYIPWLWMVRPETKCVCLTRDKEKVVNSFLKSINALSGHFKMWNVLDVKFSGNVNLKPSNVYDRSVLDTVNEGTREWLEEYWDVDCKIDAVADCFPDYDTKNKREYLERYYDDYNERAKILDNDNRFLMVDVEYGLNTDEGRNEILNFIGRN